MITFIITYQMSEPAPWIHGFIFQRTPYFYPQVSPVKDCTHVNEVIICSKRELCLETNADLEEDEKRRHGNKSKDGGNLMARTGIAGWDGRH